VVNIVLKTKTKCLEKQMGFLTTNKMVVKKKNDR